MGGGGCGSRGGSGRRLVAMGRGRRRTGGSLPGLGLGLRSGPG